MSKVKNPARAHANRNLRDISVTAETYERLRRYAAEQRISIAKALTLILEQIPLRQWDSDSQRWR